MSRILLLTRLAKPLMRLAGMQDGTAEAAVGGLLVVDLDSRPTILTRELPAQQWDELRVPRAGAV